MKKVLLVVDMLKDFMHGGALGLPHETEEFEDRVAEYIKNFDGTIVFINDSHDEDDAEFGIESGQFPAHCIHGEDGAELSIEIRKALVSKNDSDIVWVHKKSFTDARGIANLAESFQDCEFHVVGVCTHICVHDTVGALVNEFKNNYGCIPKIILHEDLVDDFDLDMSDFAIKRMQSLYGVELQ